MASKSIISPNQNSVSIDAELGKQVLYLRTSFFILGYLLKDSKELS